MKTILVTGAAGFIGSNLVKRLLTDLQGATIVGIDNMNAYYDPSLKEYRLKELEALSQRPAVSPQSECLAVSPLSERPTVLPSGNTWTFIKGDIADKPTIDALFAQYHFDIVVNLAAQAGVRYSIENPDAYIQSNMIGFYNILEACRHSKPSATVSEASASAPSATTPEPSPSAPSATVPCGSPAGEKAATTPETSPSAPSATVPCGSPAGEKAATTPETSPSAPSATTPEVSTSGTYQGVQHLVYASSSSVYGGNKKVPFSTDDRVDTPVSLYAATKKSNELFAHCYSKLYDIPTTGLRFFTVYGPAGRPDMAYFGFTNKLLKGETIKIFNYGNCRRDFTYVDDIVEGIVRVMGAPPERKKGEDGLPIPPYAVYNIGGGQPENLLDFVNILQEELVRAGVLPPDFDFEAHKQLVPMQPGDVPVTYADSTALERDFGFTPKITLREGLRKFAEWYKQYYG